MSTETESRPGRHDEDAGGTGGCCGGGHEHVAENEHGKECCGGRAHAHEPSPESRGCCGDRRAASSG